MCDPGRPCMPARVGGTRLLLPLLQLQLPERAGCSQQGVLDEQAHDCREGGREGEAERAALWAVEGGERSERLKGEGGESSML